MVFTKDYSHLLLIPEGKEGAIAIPGSTTNVPAQALSLCHSGSSLTTGDGGTAFTSHDRMLFSKDMKTLVAVPSAYGTAVVLPVQTETIGEYALAGCKDLASITVLGNIQSIDSTAFTDEVKASAVVVLPAGQDYETRKAVWENAGFQHFAEPAQPGVTINPDANEASGLTYTLLDDYTLAVFWQGKDDPEANLEIPASAEINGVPYRVSTIAENAFANRGSLTSVKLPTAITSINNGAFAGCANLSTIEFPNTLRIIGERAFEATSLKDVRLPVSIESIDSRAFASCSSLERIVALGTPEVANDALAGCTNVSIYVPSGSEDTWNPGLPSDNNHLMPYGVSLSEEPLAIEAGQEANLLEGGNLQAPDPVEASYSYAAAPLSVDAGTVSAKKAGTSDVTAVLSLGGVELTRATRTVEISPNPNGESAIEMLSSDVPLPSAYLADARNNQITVVAPFNVTFGQDAPYDVYTHPASIEASNTFKNNGSAPVQLAQVTCDPLAVDTYIQSTNDTLLENQELFSVYPKGNAGVAVSFGYGSSTGVRNVNNPDAFVIPPTSSSDYTFRLNLNNAEVKSGAADNGSTVRPLVSVTCTFAQYTGSFYLKDNNTGRAYSLSEVKKHAEDISEKGSSSPYWNQYKGYVGNDSTYTCQTIWGNTLYDVRIIGVNHDDKADSPSPAKAGLTFQFKECLAASDVDSWGGRLGYRFNAGTTTNNYNEGGWGASELRARMNPEYDSPKHGYDDNAIWNLVPTDLQGVIAPVNKRYATSSAENALVTTSPDSLFIASYSELVPSSQWASDYPWTKDEGLQYEYWNGKVTQNSGSNASLVKHNVSPSASAIGWWERTAYPGLSEYFLAVRMDGVPTYNNNASSSYGVCPCFCL